MSPGVEVGVALRVPQDRMAEVAVAADKLGYESVWLPEHLVFPAEPTGSPHGDDHPPVPPDVPTYDVMLLLAALAVVTERVRLGTWVYNLALRHPLVTARAVQTLDVLSGGRAVLGVGAGWLEGEYEAAGVDFGTRGERLDECIDALRALWTEEQPSFDGRHVRLPPVVFEPKPIQGTVPIHVGGESEAALRRAVMRGAGWLGMGHSPDSAARQVERLRPLLEEAGRDRSQVEITVGAHGEHATDLPGYADAGVDRIIVSPWERPADAEQALERYAEAVGL